MDFFFANIGGFFIGYFVIATVLLIWLIVLLILETIDYRKDRKVK